MTLNRWIFDADEYQLDEAAGSLGGRYELHLALMRHHRLEGEVDAPFEAGVPLPIGHQLSLQAALRRG